MIVVVVVKGITNAFLWLTSYHDSCDPYDMYGQPRSDESVPNAVCAVAGVFPNWIVAVIVLIIGVIAAIWAVSERHYWYREVPEGTITSFDWYSSSGVYSSGYEEYYVYVKGKTRQGEIRTSRHTVQPKVYHERKVGDRISFN